ncbi:MAG TPA: alpha/beta fold hydrolase [Chroococcales cyanobacterium]
MKDPIPTSECRIERFNVSDGELVACRIWAGQTVQSQRQPDKGGGPPAENVRNPVLLYLHGIEGHSEWFARTAAVLSQCGITVYAPDRRGAGLNAANRGHLSSYKRYLADIETVLKVIGRDHDGCPLIVMGNCWGAKAAVVISSQKYHPIEAPLNLKVAGLVLTSPAIHTKADLDWKKKLQIAIACALRGKRELKQIPIPLTEEMFTNEPFFLEYIRSDTMRLTAASCRFYFETFMLTRACLRASQHLNLPLFTIQSGRDAVVDSTKVIAWHNRLNCRDKRLRVFESAAHSIDFETAEFDTYTDELKNWLLSFSDTSCSDGQSLVGGRSPWSAKSHSPISSSTLTQ